MGRDGAGSPAEPAPNRCAELRWRAALGVGASSGLLRMAQQSQFACHAHVAMLALCKLPQQQGTEEMQSMQLDVQSTADACHAFCGADPAAVCPSLCSNGAAKGHGELPTPAACFPFAARSPRLSKHGSGGADLIWRMDGSEQQQAHSTGKPVLRSISLVSCSSAHGAAHRCLRAGCQAEAGALGCNLQLWQGEIHDHL